MALMLRKACQPILDKYDMNAFHADIHASSKYLMLFTPCGKNFATVHGVLFGRLQPSKVEIDFATELLEDWIKRHVKVIEAYIDGLEKLQLSPKPTHEVKYMGAEIKVTYTQENEWNKETRQYTCVVTPSNITIVYNTRTYILDSKCALMNITNEKSMSYPWGKALELPAKILRAAQLQMDACLTYKRLETSVSDILSELNTCTD